MAPRETANNAYAKFWGDKQRALWYVVVFSGVVNCFVQCLSSARQNRASERQVLLAENYSLSTGVFLSLFFSFASKQEKSGAHKSARRSLKRNIESMNKRGKLPYYHIF